MIGLRTMLAVADNTGAKRVACIGVIGRSGKRMAELGDVVTCHVREADPDSMVKKGEIVRGVVVRTKAQVQRPDGTWSEPTTFGTAYTTATNVLVLEIPLGLLPIFQR